MRISVAPLTRKMLALAMTLALAFSMVPLAWADDAPAGTLAGSVAGGATVEEDADSAEGSTEDPEIAERADDAAPEAEFQSADAKAADAAGSATGTTIKIAVYRSSYPLVWDTSDADAPDATKVAWSKPDAWPAEGSPGSAVGTYAGYSEADEPTRPGFEFMGWSAVKDDPTVAGKLSSLSIPKGTEPVAGDDGVKRITLHALWAPIEYSVVFDLTKNPEDASAVPSFSWTTGKGTFSDLGGGRYRLSGVTLEDYDPERGLIEISTPSRGSGGYRFLSWAEPDSQQGPTVAMQPSGTSKWYVNPVALPYYDYEPVLTARWSLSFDVDVPSQITFDEYDSLEQEGNLTDTTDKDAIDEESPDLHDKGELAHFCSQSTAVDYKIVALRSEMQPTAKDILTTSDSSKATQEQVLNDEKLLSLFAASDKSESAGVHFKLTDTIDMDDSSRFGAFVIPKQTAPFDASATTRDDEERLYVSYRLNLDNAVDGATEPNHGLVTPGNVNEGDRTPIAKVSYEFAVADGDTKTAAGSEQVFFIEDGNVTYGLDYIKRAAEDLSASGTSSSYYNQFKSWLDAQVANNGSPGSGPYFQLRVDGRYLPVQLIGICQDTKSDGTGKAGLTFQMRDVYATRNTRSTAAGGGIFNYTYMNPSNTNSGGWNSSAMRSTLRSVFWGYLPAEIRVAVAPVDKYQQLPSGTTAAYLQRTTNETVWLPSLYEVFGTSYSGYNESESLASVPGYAPFQYLAYQGNADATPNIRAMKTFNDSACNWWFRSAHRSTTSSFCIIDADGPCNYSYASPAFGAAPAFCL